MRRAAPGVASRRARPNASEGGGGSAARAAGYSAGTFGSFASDSFTFSAGYS